MFVPLEITYPYTRRPYATWGLLGLQLVVFLLTWQDIPLEYALNPIDPDSTPAWLGGYETRSFSPVQLLTHMFLHDGWAHLIWNAVFLYVYGQYAEERLGPWRYIGFYLIAGVIAGLLYATGASRPAVGASAAIAGVMGFAVVTGPFAPLRCLLLWFPILWKYFDASVIWMVGFWFLGELLLQWAFGDARGISHYSHIVGFVAGAGMAALLRSPLAKGTSWYLEDSERVVTQGIKRRLRMARRAAGFSGAVKIPRAELIALEADASVVAGIKLLMRWFNAIPDDAKRQLEQLEEGETSSFTFDSVEEARRFRDEARAVGLEVQLHNVPPE